jgi:hypothetical protein
MSNEMLNISGLATSYGKIEALKGVDLRVESGKVTVCRPERRRQDHADDDDRRILHCGVLDPA